MKRLASVVVLCAITLSGVILAAPGVGAVVEVPIGNDYGEGDHFVYLALGDSYSSGEGDTAKRKGSSWSQFIGDPTGVKFYRKWTDYETYQSPAGIREKCHVSERSYPYLFAKSMDLERGKSWETFACSGATYNDIISGNGSGEYHGQSDGSLTNAKDRLIMSEDRFGIYAKERENIEQKGLEQGIPGRVRQIDAVKYRKPDVITITEGGNDVGFAKTMRLCITDSSCGGDSKDSIARYKFGNKISERYNYFLNLYKVLKSEAPYGAKIYVFGYPNFISDSSQVSCSVNVAGINREEREFIARSVEYMNNTIEAAAKSAGVMYVDIEHSLDGHRLCDGGKSYVTGIAARSTSEMQESFHPNADGHKQIFNYVNQRILKGQTLTTFTGYPQTGELAWDEQIYPETPDYFYMDYDEYIRYEYQQQMAAYQKEKEKLEIRSYLYKLFGRSNFEIVIYSDPIKLGTFQANDDGSFNVEVDLPPGLEPGYHTVVVVGTDPYGHPAEYSEIIFIAGDDLNDIDNDGIDDKIDKCLFVQPANVDDDRDGIDDACDPMIETEEDMATEDISQNSNSDVALTTMMTAQGGRSTETGSLNKNEDRPENDPQNRLSVANKNNDLHIDDSEKSAPSAKAYLWQVILLGVLVSFTSTVLWLVYKHKQKKMS